MSPEEWPTTDDPLRLLQLLTLFVGFNKLVKRKLRLFVCAYIRGEVPPPMGEEVAHILDFAEHLADDRRGTDKAEWKRIQRRLHASVLDRTYAPDGHASNLGIAVAQDGDLDENARWVFAGWEREPQARALVLLREVFGNPFRPVRFKKAWRTDTAVSLARQMYDARDFSAMPILADALQDAGCDNADVLDHCRHPKQLHVRGCWVVDGVLGLS
jgi:hypothetical protein